MTRGTRGGRGGLGMRLGRLDGGGFGEEVIEMVKWRWVAVSRSA